MSQMESQAELGGTPSAPPSVTTGATFDSGVDALPDEILTRVFSLLADQVTLLDVLPLVCQRWCRVARDPASWARVRILMYNFKHRHARFLLHAPAARVVEFECNPTPKIRSALRRSRVVARSVRILKEGPVIVDDEFVDEEHEEMIADAVPTMAAFLSRQPHLRELSLYLHGDATAILPTVAALRSLKRLELVTTATVRYNGEFAGGLPQLEFLSAHARTPRDCCGLELPRGLVGDLVRGARALRVLRVDMPEGGDREACAALRDLEDIEINVFKDDAGRVRPVGEAAVRSLREAFRLLLQMESPTLQSAAVSLCRGEHARYRRKQQRQFEQVLKEFSLKNQAVELELLVDGPDCEDCGYDENCPGLRFSWLSWLPKDESDSDLSSEWETESDSDSDSSQEDHSVADQCHLS